jgi:hypothetical protein
MQNMKGTQDTSESGDGYMKPMNAEVILLAGWQ